MEPADPLHGVPNMDGQRPREEHGAFRRVGTVIRRCLAIARLNDVELARAGAGMDDHDTAHALAVDQADVAIGAGLTEGYAPLLALLAQQARIEVATPVVDRAGSPLNRPRIDGQQWRTRLLRQPLDSYARSRCRRRTRRGTWARREEPSIPPGPGRL